MLNQATSQVRISMLWNKIQFYVSNRASCSFMQEDSKMIELGKGKTLVKEKEPGGRV